MDVSRHPEVFGIDDLVVARVAQDPLGVITRLVRKCTESSDRVVEGRVDLHSFGDHVFQLLDHVQLILASDVFAILDDHASHEATEGRDTVALADAEHCDVDVGGACLEGSVCVRGGAAGVIVEMGFDIAC